MTTENSRADALTDTFRGDDASLVRNIKALLDLDAEGALVPHGVGGHARALLSAAAARLAASPVEQPAVRRTHHAEGCRSQECEDCKWAQRQGVSLSEGCEALANVNSDAVEQPAAAPIPYDGLTEAFVDEVARLCNDAPGSRNAVYAALVNCDAVIVPKGNPAPSPADERVVAYELYNKATGHAIVDYSRRTYVGHLTEEAGYEARPLVYARAASANETGAEGVKPVAWFIDWPDEPELGHYLGEEPCAGARNRALGFIESRSPAMATAAPATDKPDAVPKWVFDKMVDTLTPAWDYVQTHQEQFNARAGDDKTKIVVDEFLKHARAAASPAAEAAVSDRMRWALKDFYRDARHLSPDSRVTEAFTRAVARYFAAPQPAQADVPAVARPTAYHFHRFVDGQERAEGILIEHELTLEAAVKRAVKLCPKKPMTVTVLVNAPAWAGTLHGGALTKHVAPDAPAEAREHDDPELIAASNKGYAAGLRDGKALAAVDAQAALADAGEVREPAAWVTPDGNRAITQRQKQAMLRDGGASASSVRSYSIRCYADSARVDSGKTPTHQCMTCGAVGVPDEVIGCTVCGFDDMQPLPMDDAAPTVAGEARLTAAARDLLSERRRQIEAEGWTPDHDDEHDNGEMAYAAACYALAELFVFDMSGLFDKLWPADWSRKWWKPTTKRRNLVKAGGLILAEIERIDRTGGDE
ncbi:hypothetical protein [Burkholderia multivorans]|uniref:hypothetical protein n=1 Tax=Burkholderia multivorans TaxID=87883 RepID=UPI001FD7484B|nr:hypothetical protein [Burkholderia multivorans]